ncbi:MAG: hypothetical protein WEE89_09115 [Gemmatimonadota bacterium]
MQPRPEAADDTGFEEVQERVDWLRTNAFPLASLAPGNSNFSDLMPLKAAIGDARVVLLGEQSHGDGAVFLLKTRLIEFLHQEMGFDVLAFESGLYDVDKSWRLLAAGEPAAIAVRRSVFSIWTGSQQFQPLISYIEQAARWTRPLELAGFDLQFTGTASRESFVTDLESFLTRGGSLQDTSWLTFRTSLQGLIAGSWITSVPSDAVRARFNEVLTTVRNTVTGMVTANVPDARLWNEVLAGSVDQAANTVNYARLGAANRESGNRRDHEWVPT